MSKWISVKDALPPDYEMDVLVLMKETEVDCEGNTVGIYSYVYVGNYDGDEWYTYWCHGCRTISDTAKEPCADKLEVAYWRPLPKLPKEVKEWERITKEIEREHDEKMKEVRQ